jgi:hypothetical protein
MSTPLLAGATNERSWVPMVLALVMGLFPGTVVRADEVNLADNAALHYWLAFAAMPDRQNLSDAEKKAYDEWKTAPLDATAEEVVRRSETALRFLQRGTAMKHCEWGLPIKEEGAALVLPHIDKARALTGLACLRARLHFQQKKYRSAFDDLLMVLAFSRHLSSDHLLITQLVRYALENTAIEVAAAHLAIEMHPDLLRDVSRRLDQLPRGPTMADAVRSEGKIFSTWIRNHPQAAYVLLASGLNSKENALVLAEVSVKGIEKACNDLNAAYEEAARIAELPYHQAQEATAAFEQKMKNANSMVKFALPAIEKVHLAEARARARLALFKAALAVAASGPEALKGHADPYGKGPFVHRKLPVGFELSSSLLDSKGKPITLSVDAPR